MTMHKTQFAAIATITWILMAGIAVRAVLAQPSQAMDDFLVQHHIENSVPGLRRALNDSDPDVRGTAAGLLALHNDVDSVPQLRELLRYEQKINVQVSLASALMRLHDPSGAEWLITKCEDSSSDALIRIYAANRLLESGNTGCTAAVVTLLGTGSGVEATSQGIHYIDRVAAIRPPLLDELRSKLNERLQSPMRADRWNAARTLAIVGDSNSTEPLQRAISSETDKEYKRRLQEALHKLQSRLQPQSP